MSKPYLKFHEIAFAYDTAPEPLFQEITLHFSRGWTGIVGANGTGKTTLLRLAAGQLEPQEGVVEITRGTGCLYCPQRTDNKPGEMDEFLKAPDKPAQIIKGRLNIGLDWAERWNTLSHGERKRVQIGIALWREPAVLAVDEPTNHLDSQTRQYILNALQEYAGIGLLVSHDRQLLDTLCNQCVFIDPPTVTVRPGGYSNGMDIIREEEKYILRRHQENKRLFKKTKKEAARRKNQARQADKKRSKRGLAAKDHDAKAKKDMARLTGKDAVAGKLQRQMDARLRQISRDAEEFRTKKEYDMGIWFDGVRTNRDYLIHLPQGKQKLSNSKTIIYPELVMKPGDRIALTGQNGAGKSTLLRKIVQSLTLPLERMTYIPQEIELEKSKEILTQVQELSKERLGFMMSMISRLGSRPQRLLESVSPSPGETRKLLLALGITRAPHIIIMDEPTNHMDLPSIECLENALSECPCGILLVSHDKRFLGNLTETEWHIEPFQTQEDEAIWQLEIRQ
jgi:macrolide transport system ATP-binding/permease protein